MPSKTPLNIFIVDDNKLFSLALKADIEIAFQGKNIKVISFDSGEKCMERFRQNIPELVILDYHLNTTQPSASNGIKVLEWIKKENKATEVIMLTGDDNIDIAVKSFQHGASDYIVKTETKFKKINHSLSNIFKLMESKKEARKYKHLLVALSIGIAFLIGLIAAI